MWAVSTHRRQRVIHFEAPPATRVDAEMQQFLDWWTGADAPADGILRAGLAHLWVLTIHPFDDGNGRVGRALADMALAADERSSTRLWCLSAQIAAERAAYYREIEAAQRGDGDITDWLCWFVGCVERALRHAEGEIDRVLEKARFWQEYGALPLNARQREVLSRLLDSGGFEGGLSTRKYVALTRASRATAQRDIAALVKLGLLVARPGGGGRSSSYDLGHPGRAESGPSG